MEEIKNSTKSKMQKSIEKLKSDLSKIRTGRAHTGILDHLTVDYYGSQTAINHSTRMAAFQQCLDKTFARF